MLAILFTVLLVAVQIIAQVYTNKYVENDVVASHKDVQSEFTDVLNEINYGYTRIVQNERISELSQNVSYEEKKLDFERIIRDSALSDDYLNVVLRIGNEVFSLSDDFDLPTESFAKTLENGGNGLFFGAESKDGTCVQIGRRLQNPLYAQEKGVLRRAGHTEATIDMARLAGLYPAGALMEIMSEDGTMARLPELRQMADEHGLKLISIHDLIVYRLKQESIVEKGVEVNMPTEHGKFRLIPFRQKSNGLEHMAIFKGTWSEDEPILVRVHSSCATGDILGSQRCDCGEQLHKAMEMIEKEGKGVVVYLNQEGRGIGLMEKMKAYKLQEDGMDTVDANICLGHLADERDYGVGAQILRELGVHKMRLLTNNPVKRVGLEAYGLEIVENVPVETVPNPYNERYLRTKKERMGHTLHFNK